MQHAGIQLRLKYGLTRTITKSLERVVIPSLGGADLRCVRILSQPAEITSAGHLRATGCLILIYTLM